MSFSRFCIKRERLILYGRERMKKRGFRTELAYVFGIVFVALGVVLMEKADFGVSMIVLYTASTIYHAVPNLDLKRHL